MEYVYILGVVFALFSIGIFFLLAEKKPDLVRRPLYLVISAVATILILFCILAMLVIFSILWHIQRWWNEKRGHIFSKPSRTSSRGVHKEEIVAWNTCDDYKFDQEYQGFLKGDHHIH